MTVHIGGAKYLPGMYWEKRLRVGDRAGQYIREWEKERIEKKKTETARLSPSICFSRNIGVGALEIADILAAKIGYRVVDRELLEHITSKTDLNEKTIALFDERYPGKLDEFLSFLLGKKSFISSDYTRQLFRAVLSIDGLGPTLFLGRGAHLILPRERVLAVRFISSEEHRIKRLARILEVKEKDAEKELGQIDKEQRDFFKKVFDRKDASPYEFDMVINCDYIKEPQWAAEIVRQAFEKKFASEIRE